MDHVCQRCGNEWSSSSECPESCPGCGSYSYELPKGETNGRFHEQCSTCGKESQHMRAQKTSGDYYPTLCKQCRDQKRSQNWHQDHLETTR